MIILKRKKKNTWNSQIIQLALPRKEKTFI